MHTYIVNIPSKHFGTICIPQIPHFNASTDKQYQKKNNRQQQAITKRTQTTNTRSISRTLIHIKLITLNHVVDEKKNQS